MSTDRNRIAGWLGRVAGGGPATAGGILRARAVRVTAALTTVLALAGCGVATS
jgi:hypothetical protein